MTTRFPTDPWDAMTWLNAERRKTKVALVVGGAANVGDDLREYARFGVGHDLAIAINDIGVQAGFLFDHWVSLHPDRLAGWERDRLRTHRNKTWLSWTATGKDHYELCDRTLDHPGGSSAGLGIAVALAEGCDRIVLAGCPLLARHSHYMRAEQPFDEAARFRKQWVERDLVGRWQGTVKSMSGWTAEQMGKPSFDWLMGEE